MMSKTYDQLNTKHLCVSCSLQLENRGLEGLVPEGENADRELFAMVEAVCREYMSSPFVSAPAVLPLTPLPARKPSKRSSYVRA